jgi:hypothetical protein
MALGLTQPLAEMSTRNLHGGDKARKARKADYLEAVEASTSHNLMGHHGLLQIYIYIYIYTFLFLHNLI